MKTEKTNLEERFLNSMYWGTTDVGNLIKEHKELEDRFIELYEYSQKLEKALGKACKELYSKDLDNDTTEFMKQYKVWNTEQWKEWALKDE